MGYVFYKLDKREMTSLCMAAARSVAEEDPSSRFNPFLAAMMERSLAFYEKVAGEMEKSQDGADDDSSSRIVIP